MEGQYLGLTPESCLRGTLRPAGSKSLAQRALLCASVARGETLLEGLGEGEDVRAAVVLVRACGVECERDGAGAARIRGVPPGTGAAGNAEPSHAPLQVGESGTLARLATGLLALGGHGTAPRTIAAGGSLLFRHSRPLFEALVAAGVTLRRQNLPGTWPVELLPCAPPDELVLRRPVSSQEVSALLLALAAHPGARSLQVEGPVPSAPYVAMTVALLRTFGARVEIPESDDTPWRVQGPMLAPAKPLALEPDASSAAVLLAAACLSNGEVSVPGLGPASLQGDVRIVEHLRAFGCRTGFEDGALHATGFPSHGAELDLESEPDLAPVLAAVAAGAALRTRSLSVLTGLGTLPGKESDRLAVLADGLRSLGLAIESGTDFLRIAPGEESAPTTGIELDPHGDHRMAFAFALLGLLAPGVRVRDPGCVAKSWSSFWSDVESLGAVLQGT